MADKPSYLGLLNAIALAERDGHAYLSAWAEVTPSDEVRAVLRTVAAREAEHAASFAKRIDELGFQVQEHDEDASRAARNLEVARSDRSDLDKVEALDLLRFCTTDGPDIFDRFFQDHSIDIRTGELLGRYIAEERDSLRRLSGCAAQLREPGAATNGLDGVEQKLDALTRAVDELRQIVCAQSMPAGSA